MSTEKNQLPALKDLVRDVAVYEEQDKLNFLLNQEPPKSWVAKHPIIKKEVIDEQGQKMKVPYEYLPIDKVEYLLRKIFKQYKIEITGQGQSFNGVYVTVRIHYLNPVTNEWSFHDGIGASQLQVKSGSSPANLNDINNGALSMAYPLAKTLAIKDACDGFGKIFGADLNRRDTLKAALDKEKSKEYKRIEKHILDSKTTTQLNQVSDQPMDEDLQKLFDEKMDLLQSAD